MLCQIPDEVEILPGQLWWEGYLTEKFEEYCRVKGILIKQIHTSGHATVNDLKDFAEALCPRMLIPIHTFSAHEYPTLFKNVKLLKDGEVLNLNI